LINLIFVKLLNLLSCIDIMSLQNHIINTFINDVYQSVELYINHIPAETEQRLVLTELLWIIDSCRCNQHTIKVYKPKNLYLYPKNISKNIIFIFERICPSEFYFSTIYGLDKNSFIISRLENWDIKDKKFFTEITITNIINFTDVIFGSNYDYVYSSYCPDENDLERSKYKLERHKKVQSDYFIGRLNTLKEILQEEKNLAKKMFKIDSQYLSDKISKQFMELFYASCKYLLGICFILFLIGYIYEL
jgi:hypothetical protein